MAESNTPPAPPEPSDTGSSSWAQSLPRGPLGRDTLTSDSAGTTTSEVVLGFDTGTLDDDREMTISVSVNLRADDTTGAFCAIFVDTVQVDRKNVLILTSGTDYPISWEFVLYPGAAGTHGIQIATGVSGGGGATVTCSNNGYTGTRGVSQVTARDSGPEYP